ncbi:ATP-binding cassette domain-containing protein [Gorillibacterium sp. sgz5001074]|uniref:ATP-binding cassette domain-containing protein n=1 Tax=Gorillibacterium sp. sgz5001074 TaxID=3446695 RepID=UPI003F67C8B1
MIPAIECNRLGKSFGSQTVLDGIDLTVPQGTVYALLGPNGAGKTTLIHILSTLIRPDQGTARIAGYDTVGRKEDVKRSISLTGQFAAVDGILTGEENLRMICRLSGLSAKESQKRTAELLERFELQAAARKRVSAYSGGMRRRLDLAISLVVRRPVLFLDEPTTGLDTQSRRALWEIILELAQEGSTVFLTTQYLEEADRLADRIAVLAGGRIVAEGTADELKSRVDGVVVNLNNRQGDEAFRPMPTDGTLRSVCRVLQEASAYADPDALVSINRPSMDDVFMALTGGNGKGGSL